MSAAQNRRDGGPIITRPPAPSSSVHSTGRAPTPEEEREGIVWEDPPRKHPGRQLPTATWRRAMDRKPGEWARLRTFGSKSGASSAKKSIERNYTQDLPEDDYEFQAHTIDGGSDIQSGLWGRRIEDA